jgi:hypothetical protein
MNTQPQIYAHASVLDYDVPRRSVWSVTACAKTDIQVNELRYLFSNVILQDDRQHSPPQNEAFQLSHVTLMRSRPEWKWQTSYKKVSHCVGLFTCGVSGPYQYILTGMLGRYPRPSKLTCLTDAALWRAEIELTEIHWCSAKKISLLKPSTNFTVCSMFFHALLTSRSHQNTSNILSEREFLCKLSILWPKVPFVNTEPTWSHYISWVCYVCYACISYWEHEC